MKGRTIGGRVLQVIYVLRRPEEIDMFLLSATDKAALEANERAAQVIHARELRRGEW